MVQCVFLLTILILQKEALDKWSDIKNQNDNIKLHLIGRLQTNKVKFALKIFDYIHSLDSEKLANKIADYSLSIRSAITSVIADLIDRL